MARVDKPVELTLEEKNTLKYSMPYQDPDDGWMDPHALEEFYKEVVTIIESKIKERE